MRRQVLGAPERVDVGGDRGEGVAVAPHVVALGGAEDLAAHVDAVRARVPRESDQPGDAVSAVEESS